MNKSAITLGNTRAEKLRATAAEFERHAMAYMVAAIHLRAAAAREWPQ
jgi:hypothetical protein